MKRLSTFLVLLLLTVVVKTATANAQSCIISFSDTFGLSLLDPSMAYGFMAPGGGVIWYYNQCGGPSSDNWLYLDEDPTGGFPIGTAYEHFHIPFDDLTINCFTTTATYPLGVMGRQSSSGAPCVAIDPYNKARTFLPHHPDGVLRIRYVAHSGEPLRYILPNAIRVIGPTPVSVLFQAANGSWWVWNNLTAGSWSLTGALPAQRVFVVSNADVAAPWQIADVGITLGDYYTPAPSRNFAICLLCFQNQFRTVRDFLSTLTRGELANSQATSSPEVPGSHASVLAAPQNEMSVRSISEQDAIRLLRRQNPISDDQESDEQEAIRLLRRQNPISDDQESDPAAILRRIPEAAGTERQVLIAEYLLAASKLPRVQQAAAQRRLVALFESKR